MIKLPDKLRDALGTHGQMAAKVPNPPLFITGCMRSGTTFLVDKLAGHPQLLKIGSELNEVWTEIGGAPIIGQCVYRGKEHADPRYAFNMANHFFDFVQESKSLKRKAMRLTTKWKDDVQRVNYDWDHVMPMNKSPHLMNKIGYVHALFPHSKWLLIIRDVHAQCASLKRHLDNEFQSTGKRRSMPAAAMDCWASVEKGQPFDGPTYPEDLSLLPKMWLRLNELALNEMDQLPKGQGMLLSYETLVTDQERTLQRVFDFLELKAEHLAEAHRVATKSIDLINTTTSGDPLSKWKQQLDEQQVSVIDQVVQQERPRYDRIMEAARTGKP